MEIVYAIVGCLFVVAVSLAIIAWSVNSIINAIKYRKQNIYSDWAKGVCGGIDRWNRSEFPIVAFTARQISNSISSGWSWDDSSFRDKLRRKEYEKAEE